MILPRNQYVEIRLGKPQNKYQQAAPEYKTCKHSTEAIIAEGTYKGQLRKVCADPNGPIHHPKKKPSTADAEFKGEQEKRRREETIANATGLRVLSAIVAAVPVRLMKRDLLFLAERILPMVANVNTRFTRACVRSDAFQTSPVAQILSPFVEMVRQRSARELSSRHAETRRREC